MSESKSASVVFTNGSLLAKNAQVTADSAKSAAETAHALANGAQKTADGKNSVYRGSDPSTVPTAGLKEGDIYFTDNALYTWTGSAWEKTVSDTTGAEIHEKVEKAMEENRKSVAKMEGDIKDKVKKLDDEIAQNKIQTGNALNFYKEQYYLSTSYTELAGGSWSDEVPEKTKGKYVWSRYVTANVGDPTNHQYSDPVCISGLDGTQGPQGVPGPKGADGQTTYVHVAYANSADGKSNFSVNYFPDALYIGVLTDYTQADSTDPASYKWTKIKGETGPTGATGPKGDTGDTGFFIGTTPPPNPSKGTVWATNDASGNMVSAKTWDGANWVSTAFTQDLVAGNITATKIVGGTLDVNKITIANAQNIPITSTVSLGDKLSNIEQNADGLRLTTIGGGNLLNNTSDTLQSVTVNYWMWYAASNDEPVAKHQLDGQTVTLSAWIENPSKEVWVQMWTNTGNGRWFQGNKIPAGGKGWSQVTYTMPSDYTQWNIVIGNPDGPITFSYSSLQLELGPNRTAWSQSTADISQLKITANELNAYIKESTGSQTLAALLKLDPNNSTIGQVVNGQVVSAINLSSDGSVKIDGKTLHITADTKIDSATIHAANIDSIDASTITTGTLNANKVTIENLTADKIASGTLNGITITGSKFIATSNNTNLMGTVWNQYQVVVENTGLDIHGNYTQDNTKYDAEAILTSEGLYIQDVSDNNQYSKSIDINNTGAPSITLIESGPEPGKYNSTYIGSDTISSNDAHIGPIHMSYHHIRSDATICLSNDSDSNFNSAGSVGLQIESGIGLGKNTLYTHTNDLYIQKGIVVNGGSYLSASKTTVHCNKVVSQVANTVSSRLSVKTDITPVTYDRALAAVEGTDMYDYRYVNDDSNQHYVSGIIDDVNPENPQYHMDEMLINKERTARIDANLVGYHHVVLQKLIDRVAALEEKVK
ncbi:gp58-like family protein [Lactobacillus delbrueckii subsp. lactis]|uniref:gp58-like family protein n=1 Tax=Lactobacillus delbrueckii TaxID=1584 RepID=UPI001E335051|nr:gp58-like family protein [Lactobacillus delbrueckii]MCD5529286.1 gp58-like family protein [Lactobacillus delbrueckii subsp. lactis]